MPMTSEHFVNIVALALKAHVSRDKTVSGEDQSWETKNAARTIATHLRIAMPSNLDVPVIEKDQPR